MLQRCTHPRVFSSRDSKRSRSKGFGKKEEISTKQKSKDDMESFAKEGVDGAGGRVDFVQVEDWGRKKSWKSEEELGSLRVVRHEASLTDDVDQDLHVRLASHLQALERGGWLSTAGMDRKLPPFEAWSFQPNRYITYLERCRCVYESIEKAMKRSKYSPSIVDAGFDRTSSIDADLLALGMDRSQHDGIQLDAQTQAYSRYITELEQVMSAASKAEQTKGSSGDYAKHSAKLFAHWYVAHLTHWTSGIRIGARAEQVLRLRDKRAFHFYEMSDHDPQSALSRFIVLVNDLGKNMEEAERKAAMDELARAMQRYSILFTALAHQD